MSVYYNVYVGAYLELTNYPETQEGEEDYPIVGKDYEWVDEMRDVSNYGLEFEDGCTILIANHRGDFKETFSDYKQGVLDLSNSKYMIDALKERYKDYIKYLTEQGFNIEYKVGAIGYCS